MTESGWIIPGENESNHTHTKLGKLEAELTHNPGYFSIKPYNQAYDDGSYLQGWYDGVGRKLSLFVREADGSQSPLNVIDLFGSEVWHQGNLPIESGTFTPSFLISRGDKPTYQHQSGSYYRVGNLVHFSVKITLSQHIVFTPYVVFITDLPFACDSSLVLPSVGVGFYNNVNLQDETLSCLFTDNISNTLTLYAVHTANSTAQTLTWDKILDTFEIWVSGTYAI
ncbi:MAG: hypothetical protein AAFO04_24075 [Cyanobacteria bacterium J06592_8]